MLNRIVLPSVLFAAIEYIPSCVIQGREMSLSAFVYKTLGGGTYWFTSALVISEIVVLLLLISRRKSIWFYFLITAAIASIGIVFQRGMYQLEIWAWHRGVISVIFLGFGGLYWKYEKKISKYLKWYVLLVLMVLYVVILLLCPNTNPNVSILSLQPLGIVTTLLACMLLIELCKRLPENKTISYIGQNTLGFYFMSGALPIVVSFVAHRLVHGTSLWVMLAVWVVSLFAAYLIVKFINRWLPWMFDFKKMFHRSN